MPDLQIDLSRPVLVTGASGYVAGWIVKQLLELGLTVHAAVRDPEARAKLAHLDALAAKGPGRLRYFKADLLAAGAYQEAMAGCSVVFHTASPFTLNIKDAQQELITPALEGTRNVLTSVNQTASVQRVVLTSSCAAIYGDNIDMRQTPRGMFDESVWNHTSSLSHQPYSYSKTLAERAAWEIAKAQSRWDLVVINPSLVLGPALQAHTTSESFEILRQFGDGRMASGAPDFYIGAVDVRDVASAHVRAAFLPQAQGRHIISGHDTSLPQMAQALLPEWGARYPIPRRILPKWAVWLFGPLMDKTVSRRMLARNVGHVWRADNSKSRRELGLTYRPLQESLHEMFAQIEAQGGFAQK
ncbi:NAD-dependent epimerase/dehydratase family protein [Massilia sp. W12]|uniref:NAD-dependent epimerase/dehydratase family protein n=1 Tax=Massilia sp. W12 TaxID=3126507 RepID=UPI0030CC4499